MVVFSVVAPKNGSTVHLDEPIPKPNYVRLISCSVYSSWHNLKQNGLIDLKNKYLDDKLEDKKVSFTPGHYTLKNLAKDIENVFTNSSVKIKIEIETFVGEMVICNYDNNLASLLGISNQLIYATIVKKTEFSQHLLHLL